MSKTVAYTTIILYCGGVFQLVSFWRCYEALCLEGVTKHLLQRVLRGNLIGVLYESSHSTPTVSRNLRVWDTPLNVFDKMIPGWNSNHYPDTNVDSNLTAVRAFETNILIRCDCSRIDTSVHWCSSKANKFELYTSMIISDHKCNLNIWRQMYSYVNNIRNIITASVWQ